MNVRPLFIVCFTRITNTAQKVKLSIKDFFSKCDQICSFLETADLVAFTEEILNGKLIFCEVQYRGMVGLVWIAS